MKESRYNIWVERAGSMFVFNGLSGGLLKVSPEHYQALQNFLAGDEPVTCPPRVLAQLAAGSMLIPDGMDELTHLASGYDASRYDTSRFALTLVTSLGCNFDCPYCFEAKHPSIMDDEVQRLILKIVDDQLPKIKNLSVTWFGGEPLVGKKPLLELSDAFIERCDRAGVGYHASIITNGYLLDKDTCEQLQSRRVKSAQVGLDGPPDVHDRMRPLSGGKPSFWGIVDNLSHAIDYLQISVRVNIDTHSFGRVEELLQILADRGLAGKIGIYAAQLVAIDEHAPAPSATYQPPCFANPDFAKAEQEFELLLEQYGFSSRSLPTPVGAPCTAVRANELVVGSKGELYKCWESVGNLGETVGNIRDYQDMNGRFQKWMKYDPFKDDECRGCIALPGCMGGCASHAMDPRQYANRCGTFRHTYREQVLAFVEKSEKSGGILPLRRVVDTGPRMETR